METGFQFVFKSWFVFDHLLIYIYTYTYNLTRYDLKFNYITYIYLLNNIGQIAKIPP